MADEQNTTPSKLRLRSEGLDWREVDGEVVVYEAGESIYLAANPAGTLLWRALGTGGGTHEELAATLVDEFGIDRQTAVADVGRFLDELRSHGLLDE